MHVSSTKIDNDKILNDLFWTITNKFRIAQYKAHLAVSTGTRVPAKYHPDHRYLCLELSGQIIMLDGFSYHTSGVECRVMVGHYFRVMVCTETDYKDVTQ